MKVRYLLLLAGSVCLNVSCREAGALKTNEAVLAESAADELLEVTVTGAAIGPVEFKSYGTKISSEDIRKEAEGESFPSSWLLVQLAVKNLTANKKIDHKGWTPSAKLTDDIGNQYESFYGGGAVTLDEQSTPKSLYPGASVSDAIAFQIPVEQAKTFTLTLDSQVYGGEGLLQLRFPASLIMRPGN